MELRLRSDETKARAAEGKACYGPELRNADWSTANTELEKWFERDRAHVELRTSSGKTIVELWDEEVQDMVESGYLNPRDWHGSLVRYANERNLRAR